MDRSPEAAALLTARASQALLFTERFSEEAGEDVKYSEPPTARANAIAT